MKTEVLRVRGPRIKVLVDPPVESKTAGGIILSAEGTKEDNETGIVIDIHEYSYANFDKNWCDLGDKVLFNRYAGKPKEEIDEKGKIRYFRILKDTDILGVYEEVEVKDE